MVRVVLGADNPIEKSLDMGVNPVGAMVMVMEVVANLVGTLAVVTVMAAVMIIGAYCFTKMRREVFPLLPPTPSVTIHIPQLPADPSQYEPEKPEQK